MLPISCTRLFGLAAALTVGIVSPGSAETLVGTANVAGFTFLVGVDTDSPLLPRSFQLVRGLPYRATVVGLDQRPATGELYAVVANGTNAQLYVLDSSLQATAVGAAYTGLMGGANVQYGFDFNPTIDRARLVSTAGQNLVFNPIDGSVTEATDLAYLAGDENEGATPAVAHIAYDNNVAGATETLQRGIDVDLGVVVTVANNAGTLETIGALGGAITEIGGFDVSGETNVGFAVVTLAAFPLQILVEVDLETGSATPVGIPALNLLPFSGVSIISEVAPN